MTSVIWIGLYDTDRAVDLGKEMVEKGTESLTDDLRSKIQTVFGEMIANACRANVKAKAKRLSILLSIGDDSVTLSVKDNGKGFNPKDWMESDTPPEPNCNGIDIMKKLTDTLKIKSSKKGVLVLATWSRSCKSL